LVLKFLVFVIKYKRYIKHNMPFMNKLINHKTSHNILSFISRLNQHDISVIVNKTSSNLHLILIIVMRRLRWDIILVTIVLVSKKWLSHQTGIDLSGLNVQRSMMGVLLRHRRILVNGILTIVVIVVKVVSSLGSGQSLRITVALNFIVLPEFDPVREGKRNIPFQALGSKLTRVLLNVVLNRSLGLLLLTTSDQLKEKAVEQKCENIEHETHEIRISNVIITVIIIIHGIIIVFIGEDHETKDDHCEKANDRPDGENLIDFVDLAHLLVDLSFDC